MSRALAKASPLKAEIRLAQAVSEFEADLSNEQRSIFRTQKSQSLSATPSPGNVMQLTAEVDRQISQKFSSRCFGPRFTNFLHAVQQFAALGDVVVGGSQNLVACGVWSLVRMSLMSIVSLSTYVDKLSSLFMDIGRSAPYHQAMALLYPRSTKLQLYLLEYFIIVVGLCHYIFKFGQKSAVQQFASSLNEGKLKSYRAELDKWAKSINEELHLIEAQENSRFRTLSTKWFKSTASEQTLTANLRVLNFCSTYNYQTTWKQIRKAGNASFLTQCGEYQEWRHSTSACTLICTGKLGSGKSVLLANLVDDLNLFTGKEKALVVYFFCRHDIPESLQARTIIGSLARQLLSTVSDLAALSKSCGSDHAAGDTEEVLELLIQGFSPSHKVYFILDGLDECENNEKEILGQAVQKIQKALKVLVCASSRAEPNNSLQSITEQFVATRLISMPDDNPDIEAFIEADLERCLLQKRLIIGDPTLILDIQDALLKGSHGMFLWVTLQIQSLCDMKTDQAIREALTDLPKSLSETFARILRKSGSSDQILQKKTLQLVLAACRPLATDELREALSVIPGDANWNPSRILNDVYRALACCGCLLNIDEEESTVRAVHHSFRQYILDGIDGARYMSFSIEEAQRTLADIIVTYLGYGVFGTEISRSKVRPIMAQSAPSRVAQATIESSSATRHLAIKLIKSRRQPAFDMSRVIAEARSSFKSKPENKYSFYAYAKIYWQDHILYVSAQDDTMLMLSARLIQDIVELLLSTGKVDIDAKDSYGQTPLSRAAVKRHRDIVELLLNTGKVNVNAKDRDGLTLLWWAAENGHRDIVELLLNTGNVDTMDEQVSQLASELERM
ncbi:hypothetical protein DM02DRAFT_701085 [Periconia macrospinosa]|uniref:Uncharacterized protein n=1 Tax=Periconia macrospinosa TaxID=97972 RepID=A0A2V1DZH2_9PLEO|nr:hypothetical protein DM02DRAFT_701085 [Periconia macrospinosa]